MANGKKMTPEQEAEALSYAKPQREKHVRYTQGIIRGMVSAIIDEDVRIDCWGVTVKAGVYFMKPFKEDSSGGLWLLDMDGLAEGLARAADEDNLETTPSGINVKVVREGETESFEVKLLKFMDDKGANHHITLTEVLAWYAIHEAEEQGGHEAGKHVFDLFYSFEDGKSKLDKLPRQDLLKPERHIQATTKLANKLTKPQLFNELGAFLDVASDKEKQRGKEVKTFVSLSYDDAEQAVSLSRPIDHYDVLVQSGLATAWEAGMRTFTTAQIAKAMGMAKPTKGQLADLDEHLEKQMRIMATIDYTEQARGKQLMLDGSPVDSYNVKGHLFEAHKHDIRTANGRRAVGWTMHARPILYQHALAVGEVVSFPQRLLEMTPEGMRVNDTMLAIKTEILRRIRLMQRRGNGMSSDRIRYAASDKHPEKPGLFEVAGVNMSDRNAKKRAADFTEAYLGMLVAEREIRGFKTYTEGRAHTLAGVVVEL